VVPGGRLWWVHCCTSRDESNSGAQPWNGGACPCASNAVVGLSFLVSTATASLPSNYRSILDYLISCARIFWMDSLVLEALRDHQPVKKASSIHQGAEELVLYKQDEIVGS
jgi:hypothetical protein